VLVGADHDAAKQMFIILSQEGQRDSTGSKSDGAIFRLKIPSDSILYSFFLSYFDFYDLSRDTFNTGSSDT
jgi:hypothetical protein